SEPHSRRRGRIGHLEGPDAAPHRGHYRAPRAGQALGHGPEHLWRAERLPDHRVHVRGLLCRVRASGLAAVLRRPREGHRTDAAVLQLHHADTLGYRDYTAATNRRPAPAVLQALPPP